MSITICPNCQVRIMHMPHIIDIVHQCNSGNPTLDNEDVKEIGTWTDYSGSGGTALTWYKGVANLVQGERAGIEGTQINDLTNRGNKKEVYRTRPHLEFVKLKRIRGGI